MFIAAGLAGLLLLFVGELPDPISRYMVPSLVLYALATGMLGTFHRLLGFHYLHAFKLSEPEVPEGFWQGRVNNEGMIPVRWRLCLLGFHLFLFSALMVYLIWRGVF
jgi:hypothetical protein